MENTRDAPAFDPARNDYPLGGAKTGPIWRTAWAYLSTRNYPVSGKHLIQEVCEKVPDTNPETVRQILRQAVRYGVLESEVKLHAGRNWAHFRIPR